MNATRPYVFFHASQQFRRHMRSPAIWLLALSGPLAARFMVPEPGADYAMVAVNGAFLAPSAPAFGLQLGVIAAVLLAPLAYLFLRAGPTRRQPYQITDVAPRIRPALSLGRWLGDVAALWVLVLILGLSGVMLSLFRLPLSEVSPLQTMLAAFIVAAPAMAIVAAVRTVWSMRRLLRKGWGDAAFVVVWMAGLVLSSAYFMDGTQGSPFADMFGFAAPLAQGVSEPVTSLVIGGPPDTGESLVYDSLAGVTDPAYLLSRLFWLVMAGGLAWASGFAFAPSRIKPARFRKAPARRGEPVFTADPVSSAAPQAPALVSKIVAIVRGVVKPGWLLIPIGLVALAGFLFPLRGMVGPALALLLVFPLSTYGARWQSRSTRQWLSSLPTDPATNLAGRCVVAILVCLALLLPAALTAGASELGDVLAIGVGLPLIAVGLGYLTRGATAARVILLILWYGYLNMPALA